MGRPRRRQGCHKVITGVSLWPPSIVWVTGKDGISQRRRGGGCSSGPWVTDLILDTLHLDHFIKALIKSYKIWTQKNPRGRLGQYFSLSFSQRTYLTEVIF